MFERKVMPLVMLAVFILGGCKEMDPQELCYTYDPEPQPDNFVDDGTLYPPYSRPIRNELDLIQYLPNRSIASCLVRNLDNPDEYPTASSDAVATWLKASKFWFFEGEPILAEAELIGLDASRVSSVSARLIIDEGNVVVGRATGVKLAGTAHRYSLRFDELDDFTIDETRRMSIIAEYTVENRFYEMGISIEYDDNFVVRLADVGPATVMGEHLEIPMYISTTRPGFHLVQANVYNAETDMPLIHLSTLKDLTLENDVINLQAHIVALKAFGYEGPYVLKDIAITRGASAPDYRTHRGFIPVTSYTIPEFPFSDYDDVPYEPE